MVRNRRILVILLAIVATAMVGLGLLGYKPASAASSVNEISFTMRDYAQIRVDGVNGMRFAGNMSEDDYNAIDEYYDSLEFGIFIMPEYYTAFGEISYETTFGEENVFVWGSQYTEPTVQVGESTKYRILHTLTLPTKVDDGYNFYGTVHNFKEQNIATEYTACAYVKGVKGETVEYKFAQDHKAISVLEVAYKNLDAETFEEGSSAYEALVNYETTYVDYYTRTNGQAPSASYTVNYVLGEETLKTETVELDRLIANVSITPSAPRGYVVDADKENDLTGRVYLNDITLTINVKEKPTIDITEQSIGGTIGILGRNCDLTHQMLELPVDIGGLQDSSDSVVFHLDDTWNVPVWAQYDADKQALVNIPTDAVRGFMDNLTSGKTIKDVTIEGKNAYYKAKVELLGWKHSLRVLETAEDFANKFDTLVFQNAMDASIWSSYSYVLYNDIVLDNSSENISYNANTNNSYGGIIDGRGHKLENIKIGTSSIWWGIINYKFSGVIKNIALINVYNGGSNGMIASFVDGGTIENVYISGVSNRESLSSNITSNGITVKNVVYNFEDGYGTAGSTQHGYEGETGKEYITETDVYTAFGNANFFTEIAGKTFGNFTSENNTLYFCGRAIYSK